jgi:hypothetical protein
VASGDIADDAIDAHGSRGLNDDDAVDDEMPELEGTAQTGRRRGFRIAGEEIQNGCLSVVSFQPRRGCAALIDR